MIDDEASSQSFDSADTSSFGPFACVINGRVTESANHSEIFNPATEKVIAHYGVADAAMVDAAVAAAVRAQQRWQKVLLRERRALLVRIASIIEADAEVLARLITVEQGKPLSQSHEEVASAAYLFRHYANAHSDGRVSLFEERGDDFMRVYSPLGPVAGIIPWNFPLLIAAMKAAPALLTGNAIILKPAPTTPLATLRFVRLCADVVPPGLLQALGDDGGVGPLLTDHPGIGKIAFTGSTATGKRVMTAAAGTLKRLTLELGGNDPALVLSDADPESAAAALFRAAFSNAGQVCGAAKRIYVHEAVFDQFCEALATHVSMIVLGNGLRRDVTMGPVQNRAQYEKAMSLLADGTSVGRIRAAAERPSGAGYFVPPTMFVGLSDDHPLVSEEQFAPLLPILRFSDDADAIARANATLYGLTASVWSSDKKRAEGVARQIDAALVGINKHNESSLDLGLSMAKHSGAGWLLGDEGMKEFLQPHLIVW
jgi:acyl-CoA reductase-like NAD-dependent aldehyde dehydrogenase